MKPEDLRIGNTIYTKLGGGEWRPCNLVYEDFQFIIIPNQKVYKPIPLTEDWLTELPKDLIYPKWIKCVSDLQNWYYWNNQKKELIFNETIKASKILI